MYTRRDALMGTLISVITGTCTLGLVYCFELLIDAVVRACMLWRACSINSSLNKARYSSDLTSASFTRRYKLH